MMLLKKQNMVQMFMKKIMNFHNITSQNIFAFIVSARIKCEFKKAILEKLISFS